MVLDACSPGFALLVKVLNTRLEIESTANTKWTVGFTTRPRSLEQSLPKRVDPKLGCADAKCPLLAEASLIRRWPSKPFHLLDHCPEGPCFFSCSMLRSAQEGIGTVRRRQSVERVRSGVIGATTCLSACSPHPAFPSGTPSAEADWVAFLVFSSQVLVLPAVSHSSQS